MKGQRKLTFTSDELFRWLRELEAAGLLKVLNAKVLRATIVLAEKGA